MKRRLRLGGGYTPDKEAMLDAGIDESIQHIWNQFEWSFKKSVGTFTTSGSTYEFPKNVDTILEMTYGSTNKVIEPLPSWWVNEAYDNQTKSGSEIRHYSLRSVDNEQLTVDLIPQVDGETVTYKYRRKMTLGDLNAIPEKLHGVVMMGARAFMRDGSVLGDPVYQQAIMTAIVQDQPIKHKRSSMGLDGLIAGRTRARNQMIYGGSGQDTSRPID